MNARVVSLSRCETHVFSKQPVAEAQLLAGLGVEGDVHAGQTVRHRSRVAADPGQPKLRQVHLIPIELLHELEGAGYAVAPGRLGENVTTEGIDLLAMPTGTRLTLGTQAVLELTGLRNPCVQLEQVGPGLMQRLVHRDADGRLIRRGGVMAIVLASGLVRAGDPIDVTLPAKPHVAMDRV